jgi:hypothetical protein
MNSSDVASSVRFFQREKMFVFLTVRAENIVDLSGSSTVIAAFGAHNLIERAETDSEVMSGIKPVAPCKKW